MGLKGKERIRRHCEEQGRIQMEGRLTKCGKKTQEEQRRWMKSRQSI